MKLFKVNKTWSEALTQSKVLLFSNAVLAVAVLYMLVEMKNVRERLVLIPPNLSGQTNVEWGRSDIGYYKDLSAYLSNLIGQVNRRNSDFITGAVDRMMDPPIAVAVKNKLLEIANDPTAMGTSVSNWFENGHLEYEPETKKVFAIGTLYSVSGSQQPQVKPAVFEYVWEMRSGLPKVVHFDSYEDRYPHTLQWKAKQDKAQGAGKSAQ